MTHRYDPLTVADRLRNDAGFPCDLPIDIENLLTRYFPSACLRIPNLTISSMRLRLAAHHIKQPDSLLLCHDRRLRGAALAWRGHGLIFIDDQDAEDEQRFTLAHEAAHFLRDHFYPRQDLLAQFGPGLEDALDGRRKPTIAERTSALLSHANLYLLTHLLGRNEPQTEVAQSEAEADVFACEILAPRLALRRICANPPANENGVEQVCEMLISKYCLPPSPALGYARGYVAAHGVEQNRLSRLGLMPTRNESA